MEVNFVFGDLFWCCGLGREPSVQLKNFRRHILLGNSFSFMLSFQELANCQAPNKTLTLNDQNHGTDLFVCFTTVFNSIPLQC